MKVTKRVYRALAVIRDFPGIGNKEFAKAMWPDSPAWRFGPNGHAGIHLNARMLLHRLTLAGYVECDGDRYFLTDAGKREMHLATRRLTRVD